MAQYYIVNSGGPPTANMPMEQQYWSSPPPMQVPMPMPVQPATMIPIYHPGGAVNHGGIPTPIYPSNPGMIAPQAPVMDYSSMNRGPPMPHAAPYPSHGGSHQPQGPPPAPAPQQHHGGGGGSKADKHADDEKGENVDPNFAPCRYRLESKSCCIHQLQIVMHVKYQNPIPC